LVGADHPIYRNRKTVNLDVLDCCEVIVEEVWEGAQAKLARSTNSANSVRLAITNGRGNYMEPHACRRSSKTDYRDAQQLLRSEPQELTRHFDCDGV
jgi:hypothetical protein